MENTISLPADRLLKRRGDGDGQDRINGNESCGRQIRRAPGVMSTSQLGVAAWARCRHLHDDPGTERR